MKKISVVFAALAALCALSCDPYVYQPEDADMDPQYIVATRIYSELIGDCLYAGETADVYSRYQEIRSDREAAKSFVEGYYGYVYELFYDYMRVGGVYAAYDELSGEYTFQLSHYFQCLSYNPYYHAEEVSDGHFDFSCDKDGSSSYNKFTKSFSTCVEGETVVVSDFKMDYTKSDEGFSVEVSMPEGTSLRSPMIKDRRHKHYPAEGVLEIKFIPQRRPCEFCYNYSIPASYELKMTFHGDKFLLEDENGYSKEYEAKPAVIIREINEY